jgi:hypothetical protein
MIPRRYGRANAGNPRPVGLTEGKRISANLALWPLLAHRELNRSQFLDDLRCARVSRGDIRCELFEVARQSDPESER